MLSLLKTLVRVAHAGDDGTSTGPAPIIGTSQTWERLIIRGTLGSGSFGQVLRAWDPGLERHVALKLVPDSSDGEEPKFLAGLNHRNIATVYNVSRCRGKLGIEMELIEGPNLNDLVAEQGVRSAAEAALIGLDLCNALGAVHGAGLVHGDVKAENLLRESQTGRIVLVDFGLGRRYAQPSGSGAICGTPLYMAPELVEGQPPGVATDLYAAGVLLYFLVSAAFPWPATDFEDLKRRLADGSRRDLRDLRPDLPPAFCALIDRAISSQPLARFPTAGAMAAELAAIAGISAASPSAAANRRVVLRRLAWIPGALVGSAALAWYEWPSRTRVKAGSGLFLVGVRNQTGESALDGVGEGLRSQLVQSAYFELLDEKRILEALRQMVRTRPPALDLKTAEEIAWKETVPLIVMGAINSLPSGYELVIQLDRTAPSPGVPGDVTTRAFPFASKAAVLDAVRAAGQWIRRAAGEADREIARADRPVEDVTTSSLEALADFSEAARLKDANRTGEAVFLLKEAVRRDPDFAIAYMRLGDYLVSLDQREEGYAYWRKAIALSGKRRLSERESLLLRGLYALETGEYVTAEATFHTFSIRFPNSYWGWFYRAYPLMRLDRPEVALSTLRESESRDPRARQAISHLAKYSLLMNRLPDTRRYIERLRQVEQPWFADSLLAAVELLEGHPEKAERLLLNLRNATDDYWQTRSYSQIACLYGELGRYRDAFRILEEGLADDRPKDRSGASADRILQMAYLHAKCGRPADCIRVIRRVLPVAGDPDRALKAATLLARAGDVATAGEIARGMLQSDWPIIRVARARIEAEILIARQRAGEAVQLLKSIGTLDPFATRDEHMAHALEAVADPGAGALYARIAAEPGRIWMQPEFEFPGLWADSLFRAAMLGQPDALARYLRLRVHADSDLSDVKRAREMPTHSRN
jgi:serine/threonine-protein kinase